MKPYIRIAFLCISVLVFSISCKDSQMNNDPMGELTVELTGTVTPPTEWEHPMVYAYYPRDGREYGAVIMAPVKNNSFRLFIEKNTDVEIYLFNDVDNNGSFDYLTEPKLPHSTHPFVGTKTDIDVGEIMVRKVSGELTYPVEWDNPTMYIMKGNDIYAYYGITPGVNPAPYTFYTGDGNDYKVFVFNDTGGVNADNIYDYNTEESIAYSGNPLNITADKPDLNMKIWKVSGNVTTPSDWQFPKMVILKNNAVVTYGDISNNTYGMYVIEDSGYEVHVFNDENNNGTYDYQTEKLYTHLTSTLSVTNTTTVTDLNIRTISGTVTTPSDWSYPIMMLLKGNSINSYSSISSGSYKFYAVDGTDYTVYVFDDINNNSTYDYQTEKKYTHISSSLTIAADTNIDTANGSMNVRTISGTISSIPSSLSKPILALTNRISVDYYHPCDDAAETRTDATFENYFSINQDGSYKVYGIAKSNYKLWIINDENDNGLFDYDIRESYVMAPSRQTTGDLKNDTNVIDLTSQDATLDITLGEIRFRITDYLTYLRADWLYTGLVFTQGWDAMNHQSSNKDQEYFTFFAVSQYTLNSVLQTLVEYTIHMFDDDYAGIYDGKTYSARDGIYLWVPVRPPKCLSLGDNDEVPKSFTKKVSDGLTETTID